MTRRIPTALSATPTTTTTYPYTIVEPYPIVTEYTAEFINSPRIKKKIHALDPLLRHVARHGLYTLRKLILRFTRPSYDPYYFPYRVHNIVLERIHSPGPNPHFRIQWYHYHDVQNRRIDIPYEQQYYDYCALEHFLYQHPVLYEAFYLALQRPNFYFAETYPHGQPHVTEIPNDSTSYRTTWDSTSTWRNSR